MGDVPERQTALTLRISGSTEQLRLIRLDAIEGTSEHFAITIEVLSLGELKLIDTLGKPASVAAAVDGVAAREFHGVIADAEFADEVAGAGTVYRLLLVPTARFHENGSNYRIFQGKQLIDIVSDVLGECDIAFEVRANGGKRLLPYCVQYGESNFAFVSRLLEEEGLYYFYRHSESAHTMVICDSTGCHSDLPAGDLTYNPLSDSVGITDSQKRGMAAHFVQSWAEHATSSAEARVTLRDYDFKKSSQARKGAAQDQRAHDLDEIEIYRWPGRFFEDSTGDNLSKVVLESRRAQRVSYEGTSRYPGIQVGYHAKLTKHTHEPYNRKYLIIRCRTMLAAEQYRSGGASTETFVEFTTIPNDVPFRAPQVTPRPVAKGPESAVVTGPKDEEIHVDEYGRIKVQFFWDREGKLDDNSSCWVRVAQTGHLGNMIIPRIGHEVLVDFINGNPDRPIVVGRVYSADHKPVYELPKHKTRAVWRTKTYKKDAGVGHSGAIALDTGAPGANEIRFEDKTGEEELLIHAEKDMNIRVRDKETHRIGHDQEFEVKVNRKKIIGKDETVEIGANRKEDVKGTETVTVVGKREVTIQSSDKLDVTDKITINSGSEINITAASKIILTCGASTITLDPSSITIETIQLNMKGSAKAKLSAPMTEIEGSGMLKETGGMVMIN